MPPGVWLDSFIARPRRKDIRWKQGDEPLDCSRLLFRPGGGGPARRLLGLGRAAYADPRDSRCFSGSSADQWRKAIRAIGQTDGVRGVHFIAHSRGADVLASAFQQPVGEANVSRKSISESLRVRNIILFAPDIDIDVASTKLFDVFSDPDAPYGVKKNPNATVLIKQGSFHITMYSILPTRLWAFRAASLAARCGSASWI